MGCTPFFRAWGKMRTAVIFARLVRFGSPLRAREGNAKVVPKHLLPRGDAITCSLKPALPVSARPERRAACAQPPRSRLPSGARRPGRRGGDSAARVTGAGAPGPREIGWAPPYHSHASSARRAGGDHRCEAAPERWWEVPVPSAWRVPSAPWRSRRGTMGGGRGGGTPGIGLREAPAVLNARQTASDHKRARSRKLQGKAGLLRQPGLSGGNHILTLDEAAGVLPRPDVYEDDVTRYGAKERNTGTDEHRNASDNEALNEPGLKKPLNRDPAIHVNVPNAASSKLQNDFGRSSRHALHRCPDRGGSERASAEHENGLLAIGPRVKSQDRLESLAADDQRIHRGHEFIIAVGFPTARRQEIEVTVGSCDEAVDAGANKDGCFHGRVLKRGSQHNARCSIHGAVSKKIYISPPVNFVRSSTKQSRLPKGSLQ